MSGSLTAPQWGDLSKQAQDDLGSRGFDAAWFTTTGKDEQLRKTVLNLYVKMNGTQLIGKRLWDYVGKQIAVTPGRIEFLADPNVSVLMHALTTSPNFTNPGDNGLAGWDSRELVGVLQLHFKHFQGWPEKDRVEAHIDPEGLYSGPGLGRINVLQMIQHATTQEEYKNVDKIQGQLIDKGWDRKTLTTDPK